MTARRKRILTAFQPWTYKGKEIKSLDDVPEGMTHFVYLITNEANGKMYVGQKSTQSKARWKVNTKIKDEDGSVKKKTRTGLRESDWQKYCGSSGQLKEDIKFYGKDKFRREILHWCEGKAVANYAELREQLIRDVLPDSRYYNGIINVRLSENQIRNTLGKQFEETGKLWDAD